MNNMNTSKYCYYCIISSCSVSSYWVLPVKNTHKAVIQKCSVLTLPLNMNTFTTCFARHWTCHNRIWRGVRNYIRIYVGNIHSLRPDHILGDYTPKKKTALVHTRWTNIIVKSISFEYAMVKTTTERYIFSYSPASLHFCVMLYFRAKKFQKYRNLLFQSFRRKYFRFSIRVDYSWWFFKCLLYSIRKYSEKGKSKQSD